MEDDEEEQDEDGAGVSGRHGAYLRRPAQRRRAFSLPPRIPVRFSSSPPHVSGASPGASLLPLVVTPLTSLVRPPSTTNPTTITTTTSTFTTEKSKSRSNQVKSKPIYFPPALTHTLAQPRLSNTSKPPHSRSLPPPRPPLLPVHSALDDDDRTKKNHKKPQKTNKITP